jgi:Ca2+-transporting ATPase
MVRTILTTGAFFVVVMMALLAGMKWGGWFAGPEKVDEALGLTTRQVSLFFSVYVFFQVWNQINCRSLTPEVSGFHRILENRTFLAIAGTIVVVQVLITSIEPVARIFRIEPLGWLDWLCIIAFTSTVLIFAEVARAVQRRMKPAGAPAKLEVATS